MPDDTYPGPWRDLCVAAAMDKFTRTTESCGEKGMVRSLSQEESTSTLALSGFYCFSGHITLRMILFTMHRFTTGDYLLRTTKDRTLLITSKRRVLKLKGEKWLNWLQSILGRFSSAFRKLL